MTIKDIALRAGVSIATVSKILHNKDQHISEATRERVLRIVRECNYIPYINVRSGAAGQTGLICIFTPAENPHPSVMTGLMRSARKQGYSVIVRPAASADEERVNLSVLRVRPVDGVVWFRSAFSTELFRRELDALSVPYVVVDYDGRDANAMNFNLEEMGYRAVQMLIAAKHQRLFCAVSEKSSGSEAFLFGYRKCLFDNKIPFGGDQYRVLREPAPEYGPILSGGVACFDTDTAAGIYRNTADLNLRIPRDISVVCLRDPDEKPHLFPTVASVIFPCEELGERIWKRLSGEMEKKPEPFDNSPFPYRVEKGESIDVPKSLHNKKIVVIGAINQDTLLYVGQPPQNGETATIRKRVILPGGKGLNQALGTTRLGAETYLIGKIGKDYAGSTIYDFLKTNNVNTEGVIMEPTLSTGEAYIEVSENGDSSIVLYDGANAGLTPHDIHFYESLLKGASFCLLQTELPMETVEYAAALAREHNVPTILKPCAVSALSDPLLHHIDILLPNAQEADRLLPDIPTVEEKAEWFRAHGVPTVIITLGNQGCYLRDAAHSTYFEAADVTAVDTTGAADAFASALAVYLSRKYSLVTAIRYATGAAGLSVTRQGVPPALIDQSTLELYMEK